MLHFKLNPASIIATKMHSRITWKSLVPKGMPGYTLAVFGSQGNVTDTKSNLAKICFELNLGIVRTPASV